MFKHTQVAHGKRSVTHMSATATTGICGMGIAHTLTTCSLSSDGGRERQREKEREREKQRQGGNGYNNKGEVGRLLETFQAQALLRVSDIVITSCFYIVKRERYLFLSSL